MTFVGLSALRPFHRKHGWFLALLVVSSAPAAEIVTDKAALSTATVTSRPATWAWRQVVDEKLKVAPAAAPGRTLPLETNALLAHPVGDAPDPDLIALPPFPVKGDRLEAKLHHIFAEQKREAKEEAVLRRTGTGFHSVRVGNWTAGVLTVFGVPVAAAVTLSW